MTMTIAVTNDCDQTTCCAAYSFTTYGYGTLKCVHTFWVGAAHTKGGQARASLHKSWFGGIASLWFAGLNAINQSIGGIIIIIIIIIIIMNFNRRAQSAANWRNTHTHVDRTHSLTHFTSTQFQPRGAKRQLSY